MACLIDVAAYILQQQGQMTAMKLQKLVYYSQAWSLVWDERPLFANRIEAWANGPVAPDLYNAHRGKFGLAPGELGGNPDALESSERETIDAVLSFYGPKTAQYLSELTHAELPWLEARGGIMPGERCSAEITQAAMAEYYSSLTHGQE
jgi:uncharacterized phage-associated protein